MFKDPAGDEVAGEELSFVGVAGEYEVGPGCGGLDEFKGLVVKEYEKRAGAGGWG
jgi:hypothetical protein